MIALEKDFYLKDDANEFLVYYSERVLLIIRYAPREITERVKIVSLYRRLKRINKSRRIKKDKDEKYKKRTKRTYLELQNFSKRR